MYRQDCANFQENIEEVSTKKIELETEVEELKDKIQSIKSLPPQESLPPQVEALLADAPPKAIFTRRASVVDEENSKAEVQKELETIKKELQAEKVAMQEKDKKYDEEKKAMEESLKAIKQLNAEANAELQKRKARSEESTAPVLGDDIHEESQPEEITKTPKAKAKKKAGKNEKQDTPKNVDKEAPEKEKTRTRKWQAVEV